jgi:hypothetical protein
LIWPVPRICYDLKKQKGRKMKKNGLFGASLWSLLGAGMDELVRDLKKEND